MKIKRIGFSLMETMIVLLIVSIIAAATEPMISKRMISTAKGDSPWVWSGVQGSIAYNLGGVNNMTATIGNSFNDSGQNPRLYIKGNNEVPFITFRNGNDENHKINLLYNDNGSLSLSTIDSFEEGSTLFGVDANINAGASGTTVVGNSAAAFGSNSVVLGRNAQSGTSTSEGSSQVAAGYLALAQGSRSVAIGGGDVKRIAVPPFLRTTHTVASGDSSIAIGYDVNAGADQATVIGNNIIGVTGSRSIVIGSDMLLNNPTQVGNNNDITVIGQEAHVRSFQNNRADGSVAIGKNAGVFSSANQKYANNSIAIGTDAKAYGDKSSDEDDVSGDNIAIGTNSYVLGRKSIAIGRNTNAFGYKTIAIGDTAKTHYKENSIAIGFDTDASHESSTAIGNGAKTTRAHEIVLGTADDIVYIPGNLIVGKDLSVHQDARVQRDFYVHQFASLGLAGTVDDYDIATEIHLGSSAGKNDTCLKKLRAAGSDRYMHAYSYNGIGYNHRPGCFDWDTYSDRRLKNVGEAFKGGLEEIKKLEVFNFTFKKDPQKTPRVGVIAQDLMKIFPNAVFKGEDGFYKIRMEDMFYALVNAVKELDSKITALSEQVKENVNVIAQLKQTIDSQQSEIVELKKQNAEFEKRLAKLEKKNKKSEE